jgi:hypothetical protein
VSTPPLALAAIVISLALSAPVVAEEIPGMPLAHAVADEPDAFSFKGYFKSLLLRMRTDDYSKTGRGRELVSDLNRLRLSPELDLGELLVVHADLDNELIASNYRDSAEYRAFYRPARFNDLVKPEWNPYNRGALDYRPAVHRAFAKLCAGDFTATAGRQLVRFGSGRLWNPLDILNPLSPTSIEGPEESIGIDALRVEYFLVKAATLSVVANPRRIDDRDPGSRFEPQSTNVLGRAKITLGATDIAALGGRVSYRKTAGVDTATTLAGGTVRGAVLYSRPDAGADFTCAGAGYEYTFSTGVTLLAEYFYNQSGLNRDARLKALYLENALSGPDEESTRALSNRLLTYNRHYFAAALRYDISPLLNAELFAIVDMEGQGIFVNPALRYNAFENVDFSVAVMAARVFPGARVSSDFAPYTKSGVVFVSLAWYF